MTNTIHFNTGRQYTAHGQRITATLHDDGLVTFYDHDRMIDGDFQLDGAPFTASTVQSRYDRGQYSCGKRSMEDGCMIDGVNSVWEG